MIKVSPLPIIITLAFKRGHIKRGTFKISKETLNHFYLTQILIKNKAITVKYKPQLISISFKGTQSLFSFTKA